MTRTLPSTALSPSPLRALTLLALLAACGDEGRVAQVDADGDGYGSVATGGADCDDDDPAISPRATEQPYDGLDNDCEPATRDDDLDEDGYGLAFDCDDQDALVHQGATDRVGDALDQDCDGLDGTDADGDGVAAALSGGADCDDADPSVFPGAAEICGDAAVNDCDASEEQAMEACAWPAEIRLGAWEDHKILGEQAGSAAGRSVSLAGDLDGDGLQDLLVGATGYDAAAGSEGAVYLALSAGGPVDALGQADARVVGSTGGDQLGYAVASGGDLDGDGLHDLALGAPDADGYLGFTAVFFGPLEGARALEEGVPLRSPTEGAVYQGETVQIVEDLDGDGLAELLVSQQVSVNGDAHGAVEIWLGAEIASGAPAAPWASFTSASADSRFGSSVAVGDVDGDGRPDLLIGAPLDGSSGEKAGAVWVFLAPTAGVWTSAQADAVFLGEGAGDQAGSDLSLGDTDGDGRLDLLIGAPYADHSGENRGAAYLIRAFTSGEHGLADADAIYRGERPHDRAGAEVELGADLNGDGLADVVVGAGRDRIERPVAQVYLSPSAGYGLTGSNADVLIYQEHDEDGAGGAISAGDANGDGISDLLLGAPSYADELSSAGAVYLLYGSGI